MYSRLLSQLDRQSVLVRHAYLPVPRNERMASGIPSRSLTAGGDQTLLLAQRVVQVLLELARAVGALHLAVAELVDARQDLVAQQVDDTALRVARRPVVAVRVVERVDVPVLGPVALLDLREAELVGRGDLRSTGLTQVEEVVLVHDLRDRVVDDVDDLEVAVLAA